jgi:hypothetical protein
MVTGDVNRGQMKYAVEWANRYLDNPIQVSDRADNEKLKRRLESFLDEKGAFIRFLEQTLSPKDFYLGEFLRGSFSAEAIRQGLLEKLKIFTLGTLGANRWFKDYFNMGFGLDLACRISCIDADGCKFDPEKLIEQVISSSLHVKAKNLSDPSSLELEADRETPAEIEVVFGKLMANMMGMGNYRTRAYMPKEDAIAVFKGNFPQLDVNGLFKSIDEKRQSLEVARDVLIDSFESKAQSLSDDPHDIYDLDYLILYKHGNTIAPNILAWVKVIGSAAKLKSKELYSDNPQCKTMSESQRFALVYKKANMILLDETWDYLKLCFKDDTLFSIYTTMLLISDEDADVMKVTKAFFANKELFNDYILMAEDFDDYEALLKDAFGEDD